MALMKRTRVRLRLAVLIGLLQPILPSVALARPPVAHTAHPALWRLQNRDSTIWLFGTIHALPPHFEWEDAAAEEEIGSRAMGHAGPGGGERGAFPVAEVDAMAEDGAGAEQAALFIDLRVVLRPR